jgi:hypothetical protein
LSTTCSLLRLGARLTRADSMTAGRAQESAMYAASHGLRIHAQARPHD